MNPPSIDLSGLADQMWKSLGDHLGELGTLIWTDLTEWFYQLVRGLLIGMWHATLLPIPHETTDQFGPVLSMAPDWRVVMTAGITCALALLGVKTIIRATPFGHIAALDYLTGRVIGWVFVGSIMPVLIWRAIELERSLALLFARGDLEQVLPANGAINPVALAVLVIFGIRLWIKLASNVVHIAVACVWGPVAAACGLFPQTAHIGTIWLHEFFGRLAGAVLAVIASGIGLALALNSPVGSIFAIFGTAGAMVAAADLVDWLAKTPGTSVAGVTGQMISFASMLPGLALPAAGSATTAAMASGASTALATRPAAEMARYSFD